MVGGAETAFRTIITGETIHIASVAELVSWDKRQSEWRLLPFVIGSRPRPMSGI